MSSVLKMSPYNASINFECTFCGSLVGDALFDVAREYERMRYKDSSDGFEVAIDISTSESLAGFCSKLCRHQGGASVMATMRIRVPNQRPAFGPIEVCARCGGPVDMSDWHLVFLESDTNTKWTLVEPDEIEYIAVVCRTCAPVSTYPCKG